MDFKVHENKSAKIMFAKAILTEY